MKLACNRCVDEGTAGDPCILVLKHAKTMKYDRDNWKKALRRCPFENDKCGKFTGVVPLADWQRVK